MKTTQLLAYMLPTLTSKVKLQNALNAFEEMKLDISSIDKNHMSTLGYLMLSHLKNPDEKQKKIIKEIWSHQSQDLLEIAATTKFGRSLIKSPLDYLKAVANHGSLSDLNSFLTKNPEAIKELKKTKEIKNKDNIFYVDIEKSELLYNAGYQFSFRELVHTIENSVNTHHFKPKEMFEMLQKHQNTLSDKEWDYCMLNMVKNCNSKVADPWFLFSQMHHVEDIKASHYIFKPSEKSDIYLSIPGNNYVPYIEKMNMEGFASSPNFSNICSQMSHEGIKKVIAPSLDEMFAIDTLTSYRKEIQLKSKEYYNKLLDINKFVDNLLDMILETTPTKLSKVVDLVKNTQYPLYQYCADRVDNIKIRNMIKREKLPADFQQLAFKGQLDIKLKDANSHIQKIKI